MGYPNISNGTGAARRRCALFGGTLAVAAIGLSVAGPAHAAAAAPTAQLSFSAAKVSTGAQPQLTFISENAPSGALLYLEESSDGGQRWKTVDRTTATQGTARLAALPEGVYEFKIIIADNNTALGASAPARLTVTGPGGAQSTAPPAPGASAPGTAPVPSATAAPSGPGVPWLDIIVKPLWDALAGALVAFIFSLF
jgi:hypothetical protein